MEVADAIAWGDEMDEQVRREPLRPMRSGGILSISVNGACHVVQTILGTNTAGKQNPSKDYACLPALGAASSVVVADLVFVRIRRQRSVVSMS